jgi:cytochrome c-type biogenesis protein CcmF
MLKVWTVSLIIVTYILCVFGTFLTRSGIVASVHAFSNSAIGNYFIGYMLIALVAALYLVFTRLAYLRSDKKVESMVSKEGAFLFSNLVFVLSCLAVFWGTLFPTISEAFSGERINVGPPWFNRVEVPIGLFLLFLTGVGPLLAWRNTSSKNLRKNFILPAVVSVIFGIILYFAGIRQLYPLICFTLSLFVIQTIIMEFSRGIRARQRAFGEPAGTAFINLLDRNSRRWGAYTVHFGMVLLFIGLSGAAFNVEEQISVGVGDKFELGEYTLQSGEISQFRNDNYESAVIPLTIYKGEREIGKINPERRFYYSSEQLTSEVAIKSSLREDIYVVLNGFTDDGRVVIRAFINRLVIWIWIGGLMIGLGVVITLIPERRELLVYENRTEMIPADAK